MECSFDSSALRLLTYIYLYLFLPLILKINTKNKRKNSHNFRFCVLLLLFAFAFCFSFLLFSFLFPSSFYLSSFSSFPPFSLSLDCQSYPSSVVSPLLEGSCWNDPTSSEELWNFTFLKTQLGIFVLRIESCCFLPGWALTCFSSAFLLLFYREFSLCGWNYNQVVKQVVWHYDQTVMRI